MLPRTIYFVISSFEKSITGYSFFVGASVLPFLSVVTVSLPSGVVIVNEPHEERSMVAERQTAASAVRVLFFISVSFNNNIYIIIPYNYPRCKQKAQISPLLHTKNREQP